MSMIKLIINKKLPGNRKIVNNISHEMSPKKYKQPKKSRR